MQSVSSRIWTRIAVSISYDDNHYTLIYWLIFMTCQIVNGYLILWSQEIAFIVRSYLLILCISCLNFWDEAWWILSFSVFGLLFYNISADTFSYLLQLFLVKLWNLHGTSNSVLYSIYWGCLLWLYVSSMTHSVTVIGVGSLSF